MGSLALMVLGDHRSGDTPHVVPWVRYPGRPRQACSLTRASMQSQAPRRSAVQANATAYATPLRRPPRPRPAARLPFRQPGYRVIGADGGYRARLFGEAKPSTRSTCSPSLRHSLLVLGSAPDLQGSFEADRPHGRTGARDVGRRGGNVTFEHDVDGRAGPPSRENDSV